MGEETAMSSATQQEASSLLDRASPRGPPEAPVKDDGVPVLHGANWSKYATPVYGEEEISEVEIEPVPFSSKLLSCVFAPLLPFVGCGLYQVDAKTEAAVLHMGHLTAMQKDPGLHCGVPCGMEVRHISVKQLTMELQTSKVADASGNPVMVSAILNYRVVDAKKALLHIEDRAKYVNTNAQAVLKQTVAVYTYDQLKADHDEVNERMRASLQVLMTHAGIQVGSMCLSDLSYAPEVAAEMLKRQQAAALVDARTLIVDGAVKIAQDAVARLQEEGTVVLNDEAKVRIVTNLLTVTCSDTDATPTVSLH